MSKGLAIQIDMAPKPFVDAIVSVRHNMQSAGFKLPILTKDERRALCKKLWNLFRSNETHDDIREYEAMCGALMAEYGVRFEKYTELDIPQRYDGDVKEWFYDEINTVAMADNFITFYGACEAAFDWRNSYHPFK